MSNISNPEVRARVYKKYGGNCAYCGTPLVGIFNIDHIKPKRRSDLFHPDKGNDELDNYNPCCISCNTSKSTYSLEKWREQLEKKVFMLHRDNARYRIVKRFGLVKEINKRVVFYFERTR